MKKGLIMGIVIGGILMTNVAWCGNKTYNCYVVARARCTKDYGTGDVTEFIIKGTARMTPAGYGTCGTRNSGLSLAVDSYLKAEAASQINKYCFAKIAEVGFAWGMDSRAKVNKTYSEHIQQCLQSQTSKHCIKMEGFNANDWEDLVND